MNPPSIEIVVSHYQEDISWLDDLNPLIQQCIYHKGGDDIIHKSSKPPINLPNIGRESHTYLSHIIERYDTLSDLTIFAQGGSPIDVPGLNQILNIFPKNISIFSQKKELYIDLCPNIQAFGISACWEALDKKHQTLGDFFNHVFGIIPEDKEYLCRAHAIFVVHKNNILRHPREFYLKILESVSHSSDPCEGHFVERLWKTILSSPSCYDVAQKPGEWRKVTEVDGKTLKTPILHPFEEEIKKSLFIES